MTQSDSEEIDKRIEDAVGTNWHRLQDHQRQRILLEWLVIVNFKLDKLLEKSDV